MKKLFEVLRRACCKYCGRDIESVGAGTNIRGMCERCYERGGDDDEY